VLAVCNTIERARRNSPTKSPAGRAWFTQREVIETVLQERDIDASDPSMTATAIANKVLTAVDGSDSLPYRCRFAK